jgi:hypothetical protein
MEQHIDATQSAHGFFHAPDRFRRLGAIGQDQFTPPPGGSDGAQRFFGFRVPGPANDGNIRPGLGEGERSGPANAAGATGHERDFVPEVQMINFSTTSP